MKPFRIKQTDTIYATANSTKTRKLLASIYDSGYRTINEVKESLLHKIPSFEGASIDISITNKDKEQTKFITIKID